jgi:hypothetical protein
VSEDILDKVLTVTGISLVTELTTGELIYQVVFGNYVKTMPEIINRLPPNMREPMLMSKSIAINEVSMLIKVDEVPYKVGSKWKMKIHKNGTLSLVEAK